MARKQFSCDFETTTDPDDIRVWAGASLEIGNEENFNLWNNLDDFMLWLQKTKCDCYFHNLKFDGSFIALWLLEHGWVVDTTGKKERSFNAIISSSGQWYMLDLCFGYRGKRKLHTVIYDSLKRLPFPVKRIAQAFNLERLKGDIDYHTYRPIGHTITEEERKYIFNDVWIVAKALEIQDQQGQTKMTAGSNSLSGFKEIIGKKEWERLFPVLSFEFDKELRRAYKGGFVWVKQSETGKDQGVGIVFDVNSLYPSRMYEELLPYGEPIRFEGEYEEDVSYPLWVQHIRCEFYIKENHIPCIQLKKTTIFAENEYLEDSNGQVVDMYVTNVDWELFTKHYDIVNPVFMEGFKFRGKRGIFKNFIDKWLYFKIQGKGTALGELAKLMLNSLYGKFASNPDVTGKIPYLKESGALAFVKGEEEFKDPVYTPMGIFITAYARRYTISTAQLCYDRIIYIDTDSMHLKGDSVPEVIEHLVDPDKLGYWKHESTFTRGRFIRQKAYIEEIDGKLHVKCAGMNDTIKTQDKEEQNKINKERRKQGLPDVNFVTWDNFHVGFSSYGKLMPKQVKGGVYLKDSEFTMRGVS